MSKARALREKNVVTKLVKDLNKRMADFEAAVDELKILKDSITEMHDQVTEQEQENAAILGRLKAELKDNKTKVLNEAASSVGKTIISNEELSELRGQVDRLKNSYQLAREEADKLVEEKVESLLQHRLQLQALEHKAETAALQSAIDNYKKEIDHLNHSFERMVEELKSQKELTAQMAMANRPLQQVQQTKTN